MLTPLDADTNFSEGSGFFEEYEIMTTSKASAEALQGTAERTFGPVAMLYLLKGVVTPIGWRSDTKW